MYITEKCSAAAKPGPCHAPAVPELLPARPCILLLKMACWQAADSGPGGAAEDELNGVRTKLRKCTCHALIHYRMEGQQGELSVADLLAGSGKLAVLDGMLQLLLRDGHRTLLFSQFHKVRVQAMSASACHQPRQLVGVQARCAAGQGLPAAVVRLACRRYKMQRSLQPTL